MTVCGELHYRRIKNRKKCKERNTQIINSARASGCTICGYNKCLGALELHHAGLDKEFDLSADGKRVGLEKLQKELAKCIVVCANCHREIHCLPDTPLF
jgi:hypothetical protein